MPSGAQLRKLIKTKKKQKLDLKKRREEFFSMPMTKKRSYADVAKKNMKMKIGLIHISDFLKFYELDSKYVDLFLQNKIQYSYDIIENFYERLSFFRFLDINLCKLIKKSKGEIFKDTELAKSYKSDIVKFMMGYDNLFSQFLEYEIFFSTLKKNPTKSEIKAYLMSHKLDDIFDKYTPHLTKTREEIANNHTLLNFKYLIVENYIVYRYLVFIDYNHLKLMLKIFNPSNNYFFNEFSKKVFDDSDLIQFIDNNKYLRILVNSIDISLEEIKDLLKSIPLNMYQEIVKNDVNLYFNSTYYIILKKISAKMLQKIDSTQKKFGFKLTKNIYSHLFPDKKERYINTFITKIEQIPNYNQIDLRKDKIRIFCISAHGQTYSPKDYKKIDRLDYNELYTKLKDRYELDVTKSDFLSNNNILFTQPYGKLTPQSLINNLVNIFDNVYSNTIIKGLLNLKNKDEVDYINQFITFCWFNQNVTTDFINFEHEYIKFLNGKSSLNMPFQDKKIIDLTKYNNKNTPPNIQLSFNTNRQYASIKGIFEVTNIDPDTHNIIKEISRANINDTEYKLGMTKYFNQEKEYQDVFKYNHELWFNREYKNITVSDVIEIIYEIGDIKSDENILFIFNACRGSMYDSRINESVWNTIKSLPEIEKKEAEVLRNLSNSRSFISYN